MSGATAGEHPHQIFPALDSATEAALRASIEMHGVLVPVAIDQHGRIIDGHHRVRVADELGVPYETTQWVVRDDEHARELAATINAVRRQLKPKQRREVVGALRKLEHSMPAISKALGISLSTVHADLQVFGTENLPEFSNGLDGKRYRAKRAADILPGDTITDEYGDEREIAAVEADGEEVVLFDEEGEVIIAGVDYEVATVSHPARFPVALLPVLAAAVPPEAYPLVLDPFAGTGRIHDLPNETTGVEIEPEWAGLRAGTIVGSALALEFADDHFDAVVTSPTYGNRFADHHEARDGSVRHSYTHDLGRPLHKENAGAMQWGNQYRDFHRVAWGEAWRVLRPGGRLVLNIKDHVRGGRRQHVAGWHVGHLITIGFELLWCQDVETGGLRHGENGELRYPEQVFVLEKRS